MDFDVLIVDDSPILRAAIRKVAVMAGLDEARLREAANGAEALERLDEAPADLVLLDINMPVMNGEEFVEALHERGAFDDILVVIVSTEANRERLDRLESLGVSESLHKPFEPEALAEIIARRLEGEGGERPDTEEEVVDELDEQGLAQLVVQALERIAFVIVDACDEEDLPGPFDATCRTCISIEGMGDGTVWLDADDGFATELAAGLLGEDPDEVDPADEGMQAMSELANIVGGSVVVALGGKNREYRLGLPQQIHGNTPITPTPGDDAPDGSMRTLLASDEGALAVCWCPGQLAAGGETRAAA